MKIFGRKATVEIIKSSVNETLNTQGWKVIEDHVKNTIDMAYKSLVEVNEKDLREAQLQIKITMDLWITIYKMAGLEWKYDRVEQVKNLFDEEEKLSEYEMAEKEYLEEKEDG